MRDGITEPQRTHLNREYIFDFSFKPRQIDVHGYSKTNIEWYAKAPPLGDFPIYLEPWVAFWLLAFVVAIFISTLITAFLPTSIGFVSLLFDRQIDNTKTKIRLQTGFSDEIVDLLTCPDDVLAAKEPNEVENFFRIIWNRTVPEASSNSLSQKHTIEFEDVFDENTDLVMFREIHIYLRIKEFFSDFVLIEIEDTKKGLLWRRNHFLLLKGMRLYMSHHFSEKYQNMVTGLAYGGAAFLIVAIGIRGLKFIPAAKPSMILLAIFLEFTMLSLLALTLLYTEGEERMDKMLKKMEDANRSQLEALKGQQHDIHQLANVLVGQSADIIKARVESAITEYMTSDDNIKRVVAEEISEKILIGLRESFGATQQPTRK